MKIDSSWKPILHSKLYKEIIEYLKEEKYIPDKISLLKPFTYFKPSELRVVILGQAPYSRISSATGLAFSVPKTEKIPETLKNMFKEINNEYDNKYKFVNGDLTKWSSREKILLLNTALTTVEGDYNKHYKVWQEYTDIVIQEISKNTKGVCFVLLGNNAKSKRKLIDESKHTVIESIHPSPQIAHQGFFGKNLFKNIEKCAGEINWQN